MSQAKRLEVMREIVKTERSYVEGLQFLDKYYISPLKLLSGPPTNIIDAELWKRCFSPIYVILKINKLLLEELEQLEYHNFDHTKTEHKYTMGEVFVTMLPGMKLYSEFMMNYDANSQMIKNLIKSDPKFANFMNGIERKTKKDGLLGFFAYLITPVQRLPRYLLLIRELLKYTEEHTEEHEKLTQALKVTEEVNSHVNETLRSAENSKKMAYLKSNFTNLEPIQSILDRDIQGFVYEGTLTLWKQVEEEENKNRRHAILLQDTLLFFKKKRYVYHIALDGQYCPWILFPDLLDETFDLVTQDKIYTFRANSKDLKDQWVAFIQETMNRLHQKRPELKPRRRADYMKFINKRIRTLIRENCKQDYDYLSIVKSKEGYQDEWTQFEKGEYFFVKKDLLNNTFLVKFADVRKRRIGDDLINLPCSMFETLTHSEMLNCKFVSVPQKQAIMKELRNSLVQQQLQKQLVLQPSSSTPSSVSSPSQLASSVDLDSFMEEENVMNVESEGSGEESDGAETARSVVLEEKRRYVPSQALIAMEAEQLRAEIEQEEEEQQQQQRQEQVTEQKAETEEQSSNKESIVVVVQEDKNIMSPRKISMVPKLEIESIATIRGITQQEEEYSSRNGSDANTAISNTSTHIAPNIKAIIANTFNRPTSSTVVNQNSATGAAAPITVRQTKPLVNKTTTPAETTNTNTANTTTTNTIESTPSEEISTTATQTVNEYRKSIRTSFISIAKPITKPEVNAKAEFELISQQKLQRRQTIRYDLLDQKEKEKDIMPPFMQEIQNKFGKNKFKRQFDRIGDENTVN